MYQTISAHTDWGPCSRVIVKLVQAKCMHQAKAQKVRKVSGKLCRASGKVFGMSGKASRMSGKVSRELGKVSRMARKVSRTLGEV